MRTKFMELLSTLKKALIFSHGVKKSTMDYKLNIELPHIYQQIIIGCLLGDSYAQRVNEKGSVRFGQNGENHKEYIE